MIVVAIVPFLDEARLLPELLDSLDRQERRPDRLVVVDDGSSDGSAEIAESWAAQREWATAVRRPQRAREPDRLAAAAELRAFQWGAERVDEEWDLLVKLDADLRLSPDFFAALEREMAADAGLGIAGAHLSALYPDGSVRREVTPPHHVRGATKFYRRACWDEIAPLPPILGWDTIDETRARMRGWRTESFAVPSGDPLHLRPTGAYDGALRAFRRWGRCAYGYGAHPLWVLLGGIARTRRRPYLLGGLSFLAGWAGAVLRSAPRMERETRRFLRREQLRAMARYAGRSRATARVALWARRRA
jgi:biofilm PGA synthesis N-glycosyltransferase PgaC